MKAINIMSLVNAKKDLTDDNFRRYMKSFQLNPRMRPSEIADCATLVEALLAIGGKAHHFNDFFVGYAIAQISKEFDLLRIGSNFVLNIELKLASTPDKVEKQLVQNAHYLRFLNVPIYNFTFVTKTKKLYKLHEGHLYDANLYELLNLLEIQRVRKDAVIDDLFDPVNYLVSPIEEPVSFMNSEYFLTAQQTTFKVEIMNRAQKLRKWLAIEGGPGTGKTLLTYDIAKAYMEAGYRVGIVHCRPLQKGQRLLNRHFDWRILTIDEPFEEEPFHVLIIDEAQNLSIDDVQRLLKYEKQNEAKIIISYDPQLYFNGAPIIPFIEQHVKLSRFELKVIIRYNKEIHTFINCLFDLSYPHDDVSFKHVSLHYFSEMDDALAYADSLQQSDWRVINMITPERIDTVTATKDVIGQEFDDVAVILDEHFFYKENLRFSCFGLQHGSDQPAKLLFQALTRTRKRLQLIVVNNEQVLHNVMTILYK